MDGAISKQEQDQQLAINPLQSMNNFKLRLRSNY